MKTCLQGVGFAIAMAFFTCMTDSAFAQSYSSNLPIFQGASGFARASGSAHVNGGRGYARASAQASAGFFSPQNVHTVSPGEISTSSSGNRSISIVEKGKKVSIEESADGITVSVNGRRVRGMDVAGLKKRFPDAFRVFEERLGNADVATRAIAGGAALAGGTGFPGQFNSRSSRNRSISVTDNGREVSITENNNGLTVEVNGKRARAKNAAELKEKFPNAFKVYEKHLREEMSNDVELDAVRRMQDELGRLRDDNANNLQLNNLIETMMRNIAI